MDNFIFDKTDKGREEIITRKYRLPHRLRSLLVLIDGKKNTPELLQKVAGLGLDISALEELVEGEYIEGVAIVPESEMELLTAQSRPGPTPSVAAEPVAAVPPAPPSAPREVQADGLPAPEVFLALQTFFNQTIKSQIGLRGFTLQLKAERAHTLGEFRALREPFLAAIQKAKGFEAAETLAERLDQLLAEGARSLKN